MDGDIAYGPPQGLFFAGSDDGDDDVVMEQSVQPEAEASGSGCRPLLKTSLFFADSDNEDEPYASPFATPNSRSISTPRRTQGHE